MNQPLRTRQAVSTKASQARNRVGRSYINVGHEMFIVNEAQIHYRQINLGLTVVFEDEYEAMVYRYAMLMCIFL